MRKPLVIANWKMYVQTQDDAKGQASTIKRTLKKTPGVDVWVAPSFTLLPTLAKSGLKVGGQTLSAHEGGAHTGEVSAKMLKSVGASFALVGHSEQRAFGVTPADTHAQLKTLFAYHMVGVLCVGEDERSREGAHFNVIAEQLTTALRGLQSHVQKIIIAYEPVWAINKSANEAMHTSELEEMVIFIKKTLAGVLGRQSGLQVPIIYGGSVEPSNAAALLRSGVGGFLVGHASADPASFADVIKTCRK